jgi:hypothetical protein
MTESYTHYAVPECWTLRGALEQSHTTAAEFEETVRRCKAVIGNAWQPEYGLPVNILLGRTPKLARGDESAKPFRYVKRFEAEHERKDDATRQIILSHHGYQFTSLRPWTSFTGAKFPADGGNEEKLAWYKREYGASVDIKNMHEPKGLQYLVGDDLDYGSESWLRCPHCCRPVTRCGSFTRGASMAEWRALETMERHGLLGYYDLNSTLQDAVTLDGRSKPPPKPATRGAEPPQPPSKHNNPVSSHEDELAEYVALQDRYDTEVVPVSEYSLAELERALTSVREIRLGLNAQKGGAGGLVTDREKELAQELAKREAKRGDATPTGDGCDPGYDLVETDGELFA